jgi:hypothetical protein
MFEIYRGLLCVVVLVGPNGQFLDIVPLQHFPGGQKEKNETTG